LKFGVLALDYDGTVAERGRLDADVRTAIEEVRDHGIVVVLVTGRILDDLRQIAGDLSFADAVVAENGAILAFPGSSARLLSRAASPVLVRALRDAGISFKSGRCVVEASADDAPRVLALVRSLELPLALAFNRGRLMVLHHGVCKSAGLREALRTFRLSLRNTLAIGDAENDHDLLETCELGVAVEWGSRALVEIADDVVAGNGPAGVAAYLRRAIRGMRLPQPRRPRRLVALGSTRSGDPVTLAVRSRNLLVAGDPRSGKSWAAGLVSEQLVLMGYSLCMVDPEGEYASLQTLPGVVAFGGPMHLPPPREIIRALHHPDLSFVVDLSRLAHAAKTQYLRELLPELVRFRGRSGLPHRIVVDEAHYFLDRPDAAAFIDFELGGYTFVTYRVSDLSEPVLATLDAVVMTHTSDPRELSSLAAIAGRQRDAAWSSLLGDLAIDEAALVRSMGTEGAQVERFRLASRITAHVRHRAKYRDVPLPRERAFVFTQAGRPCAPPARTFRAFVEGIETAPVRAVEGHARRGDFSRWIADVFGDQSLAAEVREMEERFRRGEVVDVATALVEAVALRYEVDRSVGGGG
jgi:hydroxymethylpyrimidine pyrophosphatase-like HAD family hydrolase